jgi:hypothetical protein
MKTKSTEFCNNYQWKGDELTIGITADLRKDHNLVGIYSRGLESVLTLSRSDLEGFRSIIEECLQDLDAPIQPELSEEEIETYSKSF